MKTIAVTTDFSAHAHWATDYALELASQLSSRLVVIHGYDPLPNTAPAHEWMTSSNEAAYYSAMRELGWLRQKMMKTTKGSVDVSVVARPVAALFGSTASVIAGEALNQKADLLVMGLAGEEPLKTRLLGSVATDMIPHTLVPMLMVPPGACYRPLQTIVLAVDLATPVDAPALSGAKQFAQLVNATLDVVCMGNEPDERLRKAAEGVQILLSNQSLTVNFLPGNDLAVALDDYLTEHKADLIMLLPKPHSRLRTLLLESVTQEVARLSTIPVLAVV